MLKSESQLYPHDLLSRDLMEDEKWWVLHTKPRCEKLLARLLLQNDTSFFLPLHRSMKKHHRRWVVSHIPLFPGYLFLKGTEKSRVTALKTNKVLATLSVDNQSQLQEELIALYQVICSGQEVKAEPTIVVGDKVEIVKGSLAGLKGTVVRRNCGSRLLIEVSMLGRSVSIQIEHWMLHKS